MVESLQVLADPAEVSPVTILDRLARTWETAGGEDHVGYLTALARQAGPRTTG